MYHPQGPPLLYRGSITRSAVNAINEAVNASRKAGTLQSASEVKKAKEILLRSAATVAHQEGTLRVGADHVQRGWKIISVGPGNCPPHSCMRRSVIERFDRLDAALLSVRYVRIATAQKQQRAGPHPLEKTDRINKMRKFRQRRRILLRRIKLTDL